MGRYANQHLLLEFPDLSEDNDPIWVKIRNPKIVPMDQLVPAGNLAVGADGEVDMQEAKAAGYGVVAGLIMDWHVYDATSDEDDMPALPIPATADLVKLLPMEIQIRITEEIRKVTAGPQ
jgi:hypothetical protein